MVMGSWWGDDTSCSPWWRRAEGGARWCVFGSCFLGRRWLRIHVTRSFAGAPWASAVRRSRPWFCSVVIRRRVARLVADAVIVISRWYWFPWAPWAATNMVVHVSVGGASGAVWFWRWLCGASGAVWFWRWLCRLGVVWLGVVWLGGGCRWPNVPAPTPAAAPRTPPPGVGDVTVADVVANGDDSVVANDDEAVLRDVEGYAVEVVLRDVEGYAARDVEGDHHEDHDQHPSRRCADARE